MSHLWKLHTVFPYGTQAKRMSPYLGTPLPLQREGEMAKAYYGSHNFCLDIVYATSAYIPLDK